MLLQRRLAGDLADTRPYTGHDALFRRADALLFSLPEAAIDHILDAYPHVGRRPRSARSQAEQCALWDDDPAVMTRLAAAATRYADQFGFGFVMYVGGSTATEVLTAIDDRMHHDEGDRAQGRPQRTGPDQPDPPGADARSGGRLPELVESAGSARSRALSPIWTRPGS